MRNIHRKYSYILLIILLIAACICYYCLYKIGSTQSVIDSYKCQEAKEANTDEFESMDFREIHHDIISNRREVRRVVFHWPRTCGYGNRMYSMFTSFLVAAITESALLINWPPISNYIDCPLDSVFKTYEGESFLNYDYETWKICNIATLTDNTWSFKKNLSILKGNKHLKFYSQILSSGKIRA